MISSLLRFPTLVCLFHLFFAAASVSQSIDPPKWIQAKWVASDTEYVDIREKVEKLWLSGPTDNKKLRNLYEVNVGGRHIEPYTGRKDQLLARFWFLTLHAYFPDDPETFEWAKPFGGKPFLEEWSVPPSYEFTRVAFLVYKKTAGYRPFSRPLYERLLKKDHSDNLLKWYAIHMDHKRSYQFAKELYEKYPAKYRLFSSSYQSACSTAFGIKRDPKYLRIGYQINLDKLKSNDPYYIKLRKSLTVFKEMYERDALKAGIKL